MLPFSFNVSLSNVNMINKLQERALCLVYNDSASSFSELLEKDSSFTIRYKNESFV